MAPLLQQPLSQLGSWLLYGLSSISSPSSHDVSLQHHSTSHLHWKSCNLDNFPGIARAGLSPEDTAKLADISGLSCANLTVPVDWTDHSKGTITLGMSRLNSNGSKDQHALGGGFFSKATREHYALIGQDPRGIGMSTPVRCDPKIFNERVTLFPTTEKEFRDLWKRNAAFGESCLEKTGPVLAHIDTTNAAKDVEAIRSALGSDKLNWLGGSYGTQLGGAYAELFPKTVGRMVLDGNLDHSQSESSNLHTESATYENVLNQFFSWCNTTATKEQCPLKGQDFPRLFDELVARASEKPIPAPTCKGQCRADVNGEEILFVVEPLGSRTANWPALANILHKAMAGDASELSSPLASSEEDPNFAAYAIQCVDWSHDANSLADVMYKEQMGSYISPHTKGATQTWTIQMTCINWPVPVANPKHYLDPVAMAKAPPIMLVNAYHDPETSFVWAVGMQEQIPSSVLVTRNGTGHTSYGLHGETTAVIDAFLVNGTLPEHNLVTQT